MQWESPITHTRTNTPCRLQLNMCIWRYETCCFQGFWTLRYSNDKAPSKPQRLIPCSLQDTHSSLVRQKVLGYSQKNRKEPTTLEVSARHTHTHLRAHACTHARARTHTHTRMGMSRNQWLQRPHGQSWGDVVCLLRSGRCCACPAVASASVRRAGGIPGLVAMSGCIILRRRQTCNN